MIIALILVVRYLILVAKEERNSSYIMKMGGYLLPARKAIVANHCKYPRSVVIGQEVPANPRASTSIVDVWRAIRHSKRALTAPQVCTLGNTML
jgi:hypothetical protein